MNAKPETLDVWDAASNLSSGANTGATEAVGHQLLSAMRDYFTANGDRVHTKALVDRLNESGDFSGINRGRGLTPYFLAQHLKPYGIESRNTRVDGVLLKGYELDSFAEAFQTYIIAPPPDSVVSKGNNVTTAGTIEPNPLFEKVTDSKCYLSKNTVPTNGSKGCNVVTFPNPENTPPTEKAYV